MEKSDFNADVFGSKEMLQPAPVDKIPAKGTRPDIAYQMVKDETFAQTNLASTSRLSSPPTWTSLPPS